MLRSGGIAYSEPVMKKLLIGTVMALTLASCGTKGTPNADVTGTITNAPSGQGTIRIAVVGVSFGGISNTSNNYLAVTPNASGVYAAALPSVSATGAFKVIAYADKDNSQTYNTGDSASKDNGKMLVYVSNDFSGNIIGGVTGFTKGWNLVQNGQLVKSGAPFSGYDLSW